MPKTMRKRGCQVRVSFIFLFSFLLTNCNETHRDNRYLEKEHWKDQALTDILPPWTKYARDTVEGSFFCSLDANWMPDGDSLKYPSMIARHLFSYSVAYMLSGKDDYLAIASNTKDYLLSHAWDKEYGGWFDALTRDGNAAERGKSTFVQVYVITGLTMYFFVTRDKEVLDYVNRSNDLLEKNVWDHSLGGYYDDIAQDWSVNSEVKSFASQLAPVSGYLLYLYLATQDERYLRQSERICDVVLRHMVDRNTGWVLESFDRNWNYVPAKLGSDEINTGHNIETAWSLARLYRINGREDYLRAAQVLSDSLHRYGYNSARGFWYGTTGNEDPHQHSDFTYWWIQAYGMMFDLYMAGLSPDNDYADHFLKGAAFWDHSFLDKEKGDTHFSVYENGEVKDHLKANRYKSSYHNVEHAWLNFLYLSRWVNKKPFTLYFKIHSSVEGERLYPLPVEGSDATISDVTMNGKDYEAGSSSTAGSITLPALKSTSVSVTIK